MSRNLEIIKDHQAEKLIFKKSQDCSPIIEQNKLEQINPVADLRMGRKVASVPIDVLDAWIKEGIDYRKIKHDKVMRKKFYAKLNDPEFRYFKTTVGHIG